MSLYFHGIDFNDESLGHWGLYIQSSGLSKLLTPLARSRERREKKDNLAMLGLSKEANKQIQKLASSHPLMALMADKSEQQQIPTCRLWYAQLEYGHQFSMRGH